MSKVLCRQFLHAQLYARSHGYFNRLQSVVHENTSSIDFHNCWGQGDYRNAVALRYRQAQNAWLTPVEIFTPWYSYAIAQYILQTKPEKIIIYEIGGGTGTKALHILNYIQVQNNLQMQILKKGIFKHS